jgi:hypothetical protein
MLLALAYAVIAGTGALFAHAALRRAATPHLGFAYLRAGLGFSASLVAVDLLIFVILGVWPIPLGAAIGIGLIWPGVMSMIT